MLGGSPQREDQGPRRSRRAPARGPGMVLRGEDGFMRRPPGASAPAAGGALPLKCCGPGPRSVLSDPLSRPACARSRQRPALSGEQALGALGSLETSCSGLWVTSG